MYGWRMLGILLMRIEVMRKGYLLVEAAAAVYNVWIYHVMHALTGCLEARLLADICGSVGLLALGTEIEAAGAWYVAGELHVFVNRIIDRFDFIGVVDSEFWVVGRLN